MADMVTDTIEKSVAALVAKGKARGYLTYEEMNEELPDEAVSPDRLDTLLMMLDELGIVLMDESEAAAKEGGFADDSDGRLDIYFIDVEGGAATLLVTPTGETMLIDSGYPDYGGRDRDRILDVLKNVAKKTEIDHAAVTHWHLDHYGNHASLAAEVKINNFWGKSRIWF